jgi:hypothetical protein
MSYDGGMIEQRRCTPDDNPPTTYRFTVERPAGDRPAIPPSRNTPRDAEQTKGGAVTAYAYPNVQDVKGGKVHRGARVGGVLEPACRWARHGITYRPVAEDITCKDCLSIRERADRKKAAK